MAIEHKNIPDGQIHEPKGISSALIRQVYSANGAGTGSWKNLPYSDTVILNDVSSPSFIIVPIPIDVIVTSIRFILTGTISGADSTITVTRGGDSASLGTRVITHTGSAEGTTFDFTPSGNNTLSASTHKYLKISSDGASNNVAPMAITIRAEVT